MNLTTLAPPAPASTDPQFGDWKVAELHPFFGAEVTGTGKLGNWHAESGIRLTELVARYGVVVLRDQHPTKAEFLKWSTLLGPSWSPAFATATYGGAQEAAVFRITNLDDDGNLLPENARSTALNLANELWHTDATYIRPGATFSALLGVVVPEIGANTEFCDTRVAYEELAGSVRSPLHDLVAWHSLLHSRAQTGFNEWTDEERANLPPIPHPLVRWHDETNRHALIIASHIEKIDGWSRERSAALVNDLIARATVDSNVYSHAWHAGDVVLWDNRCTMHRATPYALGHHARDMWSVRIANEGI